MTSWATICADRTLQDLPYKVETNRYNQIVMSPASSWHGGFEAEIASTLKQMLPHGRAIVECAIETTDGIRVPDVAWITKERYKPFRRAYSLPISPEICVEIISPSTTREQMLGKMQLYFAAGAQEVWLCSDDGDMEFFRYDSIGPVPDSTLCPGFPKCIDWE
jgi:Uma2 family endonuclease